MNNLQLALTLVASTGSGKLYFPYSQEADKAIWIEGVGSSRSRIDFTRTRPKPTATFPGVERLEMKRTSYHTVGLTEYTSVMTLVSSIPVPVTQADRTTDLQQMLLMANTDNNFAIATNPWPYGILTGIIPT